MSSYKRPSDISEEYTSSTTKANPYLVNTWAWHEFEKCRNRDSN